MKPTIHDLLMNRRVVVCCGAGGVGKTTSATGLALAAARAGRRVLALTIDPSKRLAETLGVARNLKHPVSLPAERLKLAGIEAPGSLETWMLDPQLVSDGVVRRFFKNEADAQRLMSNRIYQGISSMVAGMQEYTAMEALYAFTQSDKYDLIILDTPPSRNALDFLDGPRRVARFFDGRIFKLFIPEEDPGLVQRAAQNLIARVLTAVFGDGPFKDLQTFFADAAGIFGRLTQNAGAMDAYLRDPEQVAFFLVASPSPESLTDAFFFRKKTNDMGLPFRAFVLNRSQANPGPRVMPDASMLPPDATEAHHTGLEKLQRLAQLELAQIERDQGLLAQLDQRAGDDAVAIALPTLTGGANDMPSLLQIADAFMEG